MSQTAAAARGKGDLWVALGVVVCLALGASLTYWLTRKADAPRRTAAKGAPIKAKPGAAPSAAVTSPSPAATASSNEYLPVTFDTLASFYYEIPNLQNSIKPPDQIPAPIKALHSKKISVQGFMLQMKAERGAVKVFLLLKDTSLCCFGRMPRMNEWVSVTMAEGRSAKFIGDQPVTVFGTLQVGEEIKEGEVLSVYRMEGEDVAGPLDL